MSEQSSRACTDSRVGEETTAPAQNTSWIGSMVHSIPQKGEGTAVEATGCHSNHRWVRAVKKASPGEVVSMKNRDEERLNTHLRLHRGNPKDWCQHRQNAAGSNLLEQAKASGVVVSDPDAPCPEGHPGEALDALVRFLSDPQADFVAIPPTIPNCEHCGRPVEWDIDENSFDGGVAVTVVRSSGWANTHVFQNAIVGESLFGKR